jgi:hypothetical protein
MAEQDEPAETGSHAGQRIGNRKQVQHSNPRVAYE